jgi:hypothetical protein
LLKTKKSKKEGGEGRREGGREGKGREDVCHKVRRQFTKYL